MKTPTALPGTYTQLRDEAEARLDAGTAAAYGSCSLGVDTLHLLHKLSSDPETAADALKLLHELQVHQVELALQNEEMHANEQRLVDEFTRYRELYEFAPLGYFLVSFQGEIIESNRVGAELLGVGREELTGRRFDRFLAPEGHSVLRGLLERLGEGGAALPCEMTVVGDANTFRPVRVMATASPDQRCVLLACCECP